MSFLNIVQSIFLKTFILFIVITYCTCKYKINFTYSIISDKWLTAPEIRSLGSCYFTCSFRKCLLVFWEHKWDFPPLYFLTKIIVFN